MVVLLSLLLLFADVLAAGVDCLDDCPEETLCSVRWLEEDLPACVSADLLDVPVLCCDLWFDTDLLVSVPADLPAVPVFCS